MYKALLILASLVYSAFGKNKTITAISEQKWIKPHSAVYDPCTDKLFFSDLTNATIVSYDLATGAIHEVHIPGLATPGFLVPLENENNQFISGNHLSTVTISWDGVDPAAAILEEVFSVEGTPAIAQNNFLGGKVSPRGRFFCTTYRTGMCGYSPPTHGSIYRYDNCTGVKQLAGDYKVTGGFVWNEEGTKFYFVDSCNKTVREYGYNRQTDTISKPRIVFTYKGEYGDPVNTIPFSITIDCAGYLYISLYNEGGGVLVVDPSCGNIVDVIEIPAQVCGSLAWGGKDNDILFVTTYSRVRDIFTGQNSDVNTTESGKVFQVTGLCAKGVPDRKACVAKACCKSC